MSCFDPWGRLLDLGVPFQLHSPGIGAAGETLGVATHNPTVNRDKEIPESAGIPSVLLGRSCLAHCCCSASRRGTNIPSTTSRDPLISIQNQLQTSLNTDFMAASSSQHHSSPTESLLVTPSTLQDHIGLPRTDGI